MALKAAFFALAVLVVSGGAPSSLGAATLVVVFCALYISLPIGRFSVRSSLAIYGGLSILSALALMKGAVGWPLATLIAAGIAAIGFLLFGVAAYFFEDQAKIEAFAASLLVFWGGALGLLSPGAFERLWLVGGLIFITATFMMLEFFALQNIRGMLSWVWALATGIITAEILWISAILPLKPLSVAALVSIFFTAVRASAIRSFSGLLTRQFVLLESALLLVAATIIFAIS